MEQLYEIGAIYELDGKTPKEDGQHRLGRRGYLVFLGECMPFFIHYIDYERLGEMMVSSRVQEFEENDHGVWITTNNSVYRLDYIYIR